MDIIFIRELRIETTIGVHPWERVNRQTLLVDLELGIDARPAAATDCLQDTLDYQAVAAQISLLAASSNVQLVETLGGRIAELLLQKFATPWLRLTLRKPGVPSGAREAGVILERHRPDQRPGQKQP